MKNQVKFGCRLQSTADSCPLKLTVRIDGQTVATDNAVDYEFVDDGQHLFEFELSNKLPEHTVVENGRIIQDATVIVDQIKINGVDITDIFYKHAKYCHSFNGTGPEVVESFSGVLGCNGVVRVELGSPIFLWLYDNL